MRQLTFPLDRGARGAAVADLHRILAALEYDVADRERAEQRFGTSTRDAIAAFQTAHQLPSTGTLDERTAEVLTQLGAQAIRGDVGRPAAPGNTTAPRTPTGTVLRVLGVSRAERDVPLEQKVQEIAGEPLTDGVPPRSFMLALLRARGHDAVADHVERGDDPRFLVSGVIDRAGALEGINVTVVAEALGKRPRVVGRSATNADGEFTIRYDATNDTVVRVIFEEGNNRLHVSSPQRAAAYSWVEWSDRGTPVPRPGAFELREALLASALRATGRTIEQLDESRERLEITLLAESTGVSRGYVAAHALSARLEVELGVPRAFVFAVIGRTLSSAPWDAPPPETAVVPADQGLPRELLAELRRDAAEGRLGPRMLAHARSVLLGMDEGPIRSAIAAAVRSGQVSARVERDLDQSIAKLSEARRQFMIESRPGLSSWREILTTAGLPDDRAPQAAALLAAHPVGEGLWTRIGELADGDLRKRLTDGLRLAAILEYDARAAGHVRDRGISTDRDLTRLAAADLQTLLREAFAHGGDPDAARARVEDHLDRAFPGDSLVRRMRERLSQPTRDFLTTQEGRARDLLELNVDELLRAGRLATARQTALRVRAELLRMQRIGRVTRHARVAEALLARGYESAARIAFTDRTQFLADVQNVASAEELRRVHRRARAHYRATLGAFLRLNQSASGPTVAVLAPAAQMVAPADVENAPTWEFLFGSPDYCDCEQCASVTSPAAYLVDLLLWLQRAPGGAPNAYDVLIGRRPDLVSILLNCANTNTIVPYIDLVCELLEEAVAIRVDAAQNPNAPQLTAQVLTARRRARQTRLSAEEIRAYPEHIDLTVYSGVLAQFGDLFVVPFDLAAEETRAYLALRNVRRGELLSLFGTGTPIERAAERLALVPAERALIAQAAANAPAQMAQWGFAGPTVPLEQYLRRAPAPKEPTGHLSYDELLALLECRFANPQRSQPEAVVVELEPGVTADVCRATDRRLTNLTNDALERQHRFLRLARHLPWQLAELDLAITAVGQGSLGDACLIGIADLTEIEATLGIPPEEAAFFFIDFAAADAAADARFADRPTLYARLFLSRTDGGGPPAVFRDPQAVQTPLADERARLSGALGISEPEFSELLARTGLAGADISFAALSTLYRHARLARAVGLRVGDFEVLRGATADPFAVPGNTVAFARDAEIVRNARLTGPALAVLTGSAAAAPPDAAPLVAALDTVFQETAAQIAIDTGAQPQRAAVLAEIGARRSWTNAVTSWLEIDSRFGSALVALDATIGGGQLIADLFANAPPVATLRIVTRLGLLVDTLRISADQGETLTIVPGMIDAVRQPAWPVLSNALQFIALLSGAASPDSFRAFLASVSDNTVPRATLAAQLGPALALDASAIERCWDTLFGNAGLDRNVLRTGTHYDVLRRCLELSRVLGMDAAALRALATPWPGGAEALMVRNAVRAVMAANDWLKASTTVQNVLRERRRDALVEYLLATAGQNDPTTAAELSATFLIDVEMDDCMNTSRIVQANAAVQRYVQRCFLGLENIARDQLASDHWRQWEWRHRYRLWEANRLVFLYPENFLDVSRRSNASAQFVDFMKEVRQGDVDRDSMRSALEGYLAGLDEISNLEYAALSANLNNDPGFAPQLHAVARSRGTPQKHYYRKLAGGIWSPWEQLSIGTPGRHLALLYHRGTTTLLWPTFADHPDPRQQVPAAEEKDAEEAPPPPGVSYLGYAWVTKDRKAWTPVQTTARALLHSKRARRPFLSSLTRRPIGIGVSVYTPDAPAAAGEQTLPAVIPQLGQIGLERDVTDITVFHARRGLRAWLGGDHQPHMDTTATFAPIECNLGFDCNCLVMMTTSFAPWPGVRFDDNMMVAGLQTDKLRVSVETSNPLVRTTLTVLDSLRFSIAVDCSSVRSTASDGSSKVGFWNYLAYVVWNAVFDFGVDTFAVNDSHRSLLCLSPRAIDMLASGTTVPNGARFFVLPAYHPFASDLRAIVHRYDDGLERLYSVATQEALANIGRPPLAFAAEYGNHAPDVAFSSPNEQIDFNALSPYALYNWELFFHAPLFAAERLRTSLRFEEARAFYHCIFTPFTAEPIDPQRPRARYWVTKPFRSADASTDDIREILTTGAIQHTNPYVDIEEHPFDAQRVAQTRPVAYQKHVVMRYLDNLIGWGDSLYRRLQREDVYEAIELYELANRILGNRPEKLRPLGVRRDLAFEDENWSGGANALVDLESVIADAGEEPEETGDVPLVELPLVSGLYFCVPPNRKLLKYWDDLERRLYNLRHCLTIDGQPVEYDLLSAPIDIQALVDAAAAGVSVAEALGMAGGTLPPYRFRTIWGKAQDACNEVRGLGNALLAALEKRDAEQVSVLRSLWEGRILEKTRTTRERQRDQAASEVEALRQNRKTLETRRDYYRALEPINELERAAFTLSAAAAALDTVGFVFDVLGGVLYLIPNVNLGVSGFGGTPQAGADLGGDNVGSSVRQSSQGLSRLAGLLDRAGSLTLTQASYARRKEEWDRLANETVAEIATLDKQIAAANLRAAVAEAELEGHATQEQSWAATDAILAEKFTNEERYEWMIESLRDLHQQAFQHALRLARIARECLVFEMPAGTNVAAIGQGHWDSLQHGLLAGERLSADLRELDVIYTTEATHEREVTQHVALSHVAPDALITLRRTGQCTFRIPRWWFQRFDPGLTGRRVRTLSVSVPSVTGPYVGMNASLSLQGQHRTRSAISLSTGVNDFGVDVAANGDRYMPFEGLSLEAETAWNFGFPSDPQVAGRIVTDVEPSTISDVILHFQYTATFGAAALDGPPNLVAFVDLRQMAADAWNALVSTQAHQATVTVPALVPRFLTGYRVDAIVDSVVLSRQGGVITNQFTFTVGLEGAITIAPQPNQVIDWAGVSRVYVVTSMVR